MKKTVSIALAALLLLGTLAGCGAKKEAPAATSAPAPTEAPKPTAEPTPAPTPEPTEAPARSEAPITGTPDGSVIFEKDGVKVTTAGLDTDPSSADVLPIIWVDVENTGDKDVCLGVRDGAVNGVMCTTVLVCYAEEDGQLYSTDYSFDLTVPAGSSSRCALSYYKPDIPGLDMDALATFECRFTAAEDEFTSPYFVSERVTVETGEVVDHADITALGTVVADDDRLLLVIGEQTYDDWLGPQVFVYALNKGEKYLGITADAAEADGVGCDYIYYGDYAAPGRLTAGWISFEGGIQELKGFESLSITFSVCEGDSVDDLDSSAGETLGPVAVTYPPQIWGEYENGGYTLEIKPKYNALVTVETPENDENGVLFTVSETASREAGGYEGAGWLFSTGKVGEDKLHEMLCYDMSGADVFAKDADGNYFIWYRPTDVRYERATVEEMQRDAAQWSMLGKWASEMADSFRDKNGLEYASYGNSEVEMLLSRAAWEKSADCYLATTEYMDVDARAVDGTPFAEFVLRSGFWRIEPEDLPDADYLTGENLVLGFAGEDVFLHFYPVDGGYVVLQQGEEETIYQAGWEDEHISNYDAMRGWYYACAEQTGVKAPDHSLDPFLGAWHEQIAGRGTLDITKSVAPGRVTITGRWPGSAFDAAEWELVGALDEDGNLTYENGHWEVKDFDEDGTGWTTDESWEESGRFTLGDAGELLWHDDNLRVSDESVFVR